MKAAGLLFVCCLIRLVQYVFMEEKCPMTKEKRGYDFVVGTLSPKTGESPLEEWVGSYKERVKCFKTPHYVNLKVDEVLRMPYDGWTNISQGMNKSIADQAGTKIDVGLSVVIGPFYMNLAMILEDIGIPYIVTDYMGFDWSDISRVDDKVRWKNIVQVRPPMVEFNRAVVDFFVLEKWESAVMIMPENPKDNQECQNLASQMVENNISPIAYSLQLQNRTLMKNNTAEVLRNVKLLEQEKIIICSPRDEMYKLIQLVLDEAALFNMLSENTYSFFILDPTTHLSSLSEINMYRNGLFAAKCNLYAYRYKDITKDSKTFSSPYAFGAADAAAIIRDAKYYYASEPNIAPTDILSKERFLESLKKVKIVNAMTGRIEFNSSGSRVNYHLSLYNHGGIGLYKKIGSWNSSASTPKERLTFLDINETDVQESRGIFREVETVVVVLEEPFVMYRPKPKGVTFVGNEQFEGFTIDLLNRISQDLQFKYEIILSPGNAYGQKDKTGDWNGMVGSIRAGNATLGMGAISITSQREEAIDFSLGILSTGVNILVTQPEEKFNIFQFLQPFSLELWMAIIGSSVGVSIIYYILDFRKRENRKFTIKSTMWFSVGTLLMKGSDFSPKATSQRILTTGFLFFVLITVSTYTANMAAFLTKENLEEPIDSFQQLAERDDVKILTVADSATMNFLKTSPEGTVYHTIWERIEKGDGLVTNATVGRFLVEKGDHAFIFDSMINSYSERKYCETKSVSSPILLQEHGIAMWPGAAFKSQLNIELLKLKEQGFILELRKKWWENTRECDLDFQGRSSSQVSFGLEHMAGVFVVGSFGLGVSLAFFLSKKLFVVIQRHTTFGMPRDDVSNGAASAKSEEKQKDPLLFGVPEGKQSTV